MYGRHFESMYTGSMYGQGFGLFAIWGYVISHEWGGIVELNPKLLSDVFGEPIETVSTLVNKLCDPDDDSRSRSQEGRRLVKIGQFAYQVVNAAEYRKMASEADRRHYLTQKQREHRSRQHLSTNVNTEDADADANSNAKEEEEVNKKKTTTSTPKETKSHKGTSADRIISAWQKLPLPPEKKTFAPADILAIERAISILAGDSQEPVHEGMILEAIENYRQALSLSDSQTYKHKLHPWLMEHIRKYVSYNFDIEHHHKSNFDKKGKGQTHADFESEMEKAKARGDL